VTAVLGSSRYALDAARVERALRMVALVPVPDAAHGVAGLVDVHGELLPVVDPRPRLGLPAATPHPDQHLLIVRAATRFALWVDAVERVDAVDETGSTGGRETRIARVAGQVVPLLPLDTLAPEAR
jgi:purine-binding chemotaxis protein CheW